MPFILTLVPPGSCLFLYSGTIADNIAYGVDKKVHTFPALSLTFVSDPVSVCLSICLFLSVNPSVCLSVCDAIVLMHTLTLVTLSPLHSSAITTNVSSSHIFSCQLDGLQDAQTLRMRVENAAKTANAHDFISAFPQGLESHSFEFVCLL